MGPLACSTGPEAQGPGNDTGNTGGDPVTGAGGSGMPVGSGGSGQEQGSGGDGAVVGTGGGGSPSVDELTIVDAPTGEAEITVAINSQTSHPISPNVYGMNVGQMPAEEVAALAKEVGFGLARAGGNRYSAYNWETNASNAGSDWMFHNDDYLAEGDEPGAGVDGVLSQAEAGIINALITTQLGDYVAADKDGTDVTLTENYLETRFFENVLVKGSAFSTTPDTTDGMVYQDEFLNWAGVTYPKANILVALDNEPDLWSHTHAPIWPEELINYDEVVQRNIESAKMVKATLPNAEVLGLASFGWYGWKTLVDSPDFATEGEFLNYYLDALAQAEQDEGLRLIDYVDLHWYPEAEGDDARIINNITSPGAVEARLQAPRSLWDETYVEDSWITRDDITGEAIALLPRIQAQIEEHYPGTKLAIAEWDYGANNHISGGIAAADVLGIFGREQVGQSSHWIASSDHYFTYGAYQVYRNYDGEGGKFGSLSVEATTSAPDQSSVYAALDPDDPSIMTVVMINKGESAKIAELNITHDQQLMGTRVYVLDAGAEDKANLVARPQPRNSVRAVAPNQFKYEMPPMSVSLLVASTDGEVAPSSSWPAPTVLGEATGTTFDSDAEGWTIVGTTDIDAGSTLEWDAAEGDPDAGSISVLVPFTDREQKVEVGPSDGTLNLQDNRLSLKVKRTGEFDGGVMVYFIAGESWTAHGWTMLPNEDWVTIDVSLDALLEFDPTFDPTAVTEWGVMFNTGESGSTVPGTVTFHVDSVLTQAIE